MGRSQSEMIVYIYIRIAAYINKCVDHLSGLGDLGDLGGLSDLCGL